MYWRRSGNGYDSRKKIETLAKLSLSVEEERVSSGIEHFRDNWRLLPTFFVVRAPSGIGAGWIMAGPTPIPFTAIAEEYIHS